MGQKVNAIGFRLGVNKPWNSHWYAPMFSTDHGYIHMLKEDFKISHYMKSVLRDESLITHVQNIQRKSGQIHVLLNMNHLKMKSRMKKKNVYDENTQESQVLKQMTHVKPQWLHVSYDDDILISHKNHLPVSTFKSHSIVFKWRRYVHHLRMQAHMHDHMMKTFGSDKIQMMKHVLNILKPKIEHIQNELKIMEPTFTHVYMNTSSVHVYNQLKAKLFLCKYIYHKCISFKKSWKDYKNLKTAKLKKLNTQNLSFKQDENVHMIMKNIYKDFKIFKKKFKILYDSLKLFQHTYIQLNDLNSSNVLLKSFKFHKLKPLTLKLYKYVKTYKQLHLLKHTFLKKLETFKSHDLMFSKIIYNNNSHMNHIKDLKPIQHMISNMMYKSKKKTFMINEELFRSYISSLCHGFATYDLLHSQMYDSLKSFISKIHMLKLKLFQWKTKSKFFHTHTYDAHAINSYDILPYHMKKFKDRIHKMNHIPLTHLAIHEKKIKSYEKIFASLYNKNPFINPFQINHMNKFGDNSQRIKKRLRSEDVNKKKKFKRKVLISTSLNKFLTNMKSNLQLMVPSHIHTMIKTSRKIYKMPYNIHYLAQNVATTLGTSKYKRKFVSLFTDLSQKLSQIMGHLNEKKHRARKIRGFRMQYAGKLWSKGRAKKKVVNHGTISLQNISQLIHYEFIHQTTKYGVTGFKLWLNYSPLKNKINASVNYKPYAHVFHQKHQLRFLRLFLIYMKEKLKKKLLHT